MEYQFYPDKVVIKNAERFDLAQTFDCGQCFRFREDGASSFTGVAFGKVITLRQDKQNRTVTIENADEHDFVSLWQNYFTLDMDYAKIAERLSTDETMVCAINAGSGIRMLRQELWEALISFIVSQNNNIPRIRKIIEALCEACGEKITYKDKTYFSFPTPQALSVLTQADLKGFGCGYRDSYIYEITQKTVGGEFDPQKLKLLSTEAARAELLKVKGIGGKVADCILLFGLSRYEVCPHDVWVKRIFTKYYGITDITEKKGYALASSKWGEYAGIAQQYLFYAEREKQ